VTPVVRFRNPDFGTVSWNDLVKGPITISNTELDDLVIARGDGVPTYNFAVVVDDIDMAITHVLRGDDHVNNTPRQINIYHAILGPGAALPKFGHLPMILGPDGQKLSKRHGAVSVLQYRDDGFLPEALFNYLARLGWSHGDVEKFSRDELTLWFDLDHVNRAPAQYDMAKLLWLNGEYMKEADPARLAKLIEPMVAQRAAKPEESPALPSPAGAEAGPGVRAPISPPLELVVALLKDPRPHPERAGRRSDAVLPGTPHRARPAAPAPDRQEPGRRARVCPGGHHDPVAAHRDRGPEQAADRRLRHQDAPARGAAARGSDRPHANPEHRRLYWN